jgi:glycosyltransferase involved in cell wall biosynthesis
LIFNIVFKKSGGAGRAASNLSKTIGSDSHTLSIDSKLIRNRKLKLILIYLFAVLDNYLIKKFKSKSFFSITRSTFNSIDKMEEFSTGNILHLHWIPGMISLNKLASLRAETRIIITLHDMWFFTGGCHFSSGCEKFKTGCHNCPQVRKGLKGQVVKQFETKQQIMNKFKDIRFIAPSKWMQEQAERSKILSGKKIDLIENIAPESCINRKPRGGLREEYGLSNTEFAIGFISVKLKDKRKNMGELIYAISRLSLKLNKSIDPVLVTKGKGRVEKSKFIKIINLGFSNKSEDLSDFYGILDVIVVPSVEDNAPLVVYEALSNNVPVVYRKSGGLADQMEGIALGIGYTSTEELIEILNSVANRNHAVISMENNFNNVRRNAYVRKRHLEIYGNNE